MLRTGEAILQVAPRTSDGMRQRLWIARPRKVGESGTARADLKLPPKAHAPGRLLLVG